MSPARPAVAELHVGDEPSVWEGLGFTVRDGAVHVGGVTVRPIGGPEPGLVRWVLRDAPQQDLDGLPTAHTATHPAPADTHPNGALGIDHVVVMTPDRARTSAALDAAGLGLRRIREYAGTEARPLEQAFHRAGEVIVEVVGPPTPDANRAGEPASFWGLVAVTADIDGAAALLGPALGPAHPAVQPGRRIATVRPAAGSTVPLAFLSPDV